MEQPKAKRVRAINWDSSDKILLRQLIEDKISIVENKNCDTNTSRMKKDAWREITNSFNNMSATIRDTAQLQAQWRGAKMKAKMIASAYKKSLHATGRGPPPKSPDPEQSKLMALIPQEFEEDYNEFDCDYEIKKENIPKDTTSRNTKQESQSKRKGPLIAIHQYEDTEDAEDIEAMEDIEFLENEFPPKNPPPPPPASPLPPASASRLDSTKKSKSFKRKITSKEDELLKQELFELAVDNRRNEKI